MNLQQIAALSVDGKASTAKVQALITKKQTENAAKAKRLQDNQTKLQQSGSLMNDAARAQLEKRSRGNRSTSSASSRTRRPRSPSCRRELQGDFQQKLFPILNQMVAGKGAARALQRRGCRRHRRPIRASI